MHLKRADVSLRLLVLFLCYGALLKSFSEFTPGDSCLVFAPSCNAIVKRKGKTIYSITLAKSPAVAIFVVSYQHPVVLQAQLLIGGIEPNPGPVGAPSIDIRPGDAVCGGNATIENDVSEP